MKNTILLQLSTKTQVLSSLAVNFLERHTDGTGSAVIVGWNKTVKEHV